MPRTYTEEKTAFTFAELDERAKERARDWMRKGIGEDTYWAEGVLDNAADVCAMLGIRLATRTAKLMGGGTRQEPIIYWSGFSSQGDGASFEGTYAYKRGSVAAITSEWPQDVELHRIAKALQAIQRRHFYRLEARMDHRGRYSYPESVDISVESTGYDHVSKETHEAVCDLLRDVMHWVYRSLEREWDYQNSAKVIDDTIAANEYEFTEDGRVI